MKTISQSLIDHQSDFWWSSRLLVLVQNKNVSKMVAQKKTVTPKSKDNANENIDLFNRGRDAIAKLRENNFTFVEVPVEEIDFYEIGFDEKKQKPVQNLEFEHNGENLRLAVQNPSILADIISAVEQYSEGNTDALVKLPVKSSNPKLMKENEGTHWVY